MGYAVKLDVFEGPLDLLLHLITRQRVDIYEVSLASIAGDYLAAVEAMPELDLESATGFLVVAASLVELKSARLLPTPGMDGEREAWVEERDLLLARLVECATFRGAGEWLGTRLDESGRLFPRVVALEERFAGLGPVPVEQVSPSALGAAAAALLHPPVSPKVDTGHVAPIVASVREAVAEVAVVLRESGTASFRDLCRSTADRIEIVVRFLALLELFKAGAVELSQPERFGDIAASWTDDVPVETLLATVEEYVLE